MENTQTYVLLDRAQGKIEAGPDQQERLEEFTARVLSGEFHVPIQGTSMIPRVCIDGRPGCEDLGPNASGGTFSLTVADDLTTQRYSRGGSLADAHEKVTADLQAEGYQIGGHCADHAAEGRCGCGAEDEVEPEYRFIADNGDFLRETTEGLLGIEVSDEVHDLIMRRTAERTSFSTGREISNALRRTGGSAVEPALQGAHNEVVAAINTREGMTLDRQALAAEFGPLYQAFNLDVPSLYAGAEALAVSDDEVNQLVVAAVYFNLAVAHVLTGTKMRVGLVE